jgi:hypothetical protein
MNEPPLFWVMVGILIGVPIGMLIVTTALMR